MASLVRTAAALLFVILLGLFARATDKRQAANIEGDVFEKCADHKLVGPVSGAVVSTSVDATTATTDTTGHFHLLTKNPVFGDEFYEVTVRSDDAVVDDNFSLSPVDPKLPAGSPVPLTFVLSPPVPVAASRDRKSGQMFCAFFPSGWVGAKRQK
jgi:hypothetical protein